MNRYSKCLCATVCMYVSAKSQRMVNENLFFSLFVLKQKLNDIDKQNKNVNNRDKKTKKKKQKKNYRKKKQRKQ